MATLPQPDSDYYEVLEVSREDHGPILNYRIIQDQNLDHNPHSVETTVPIENVRLPKYVFK
jgi:hypothetical protein